MADISKQPGAMATSANNEEHSLADDLQAMNLRPRSLEWPDKEQLLKECVDITDLVDCLVTPDREYSKFFRNLCDSSSEYSDSEASLSGHGTALADNSADNAEGSEHKSCTESSGSLERDGETSDDNDSELTASDSETADQAPDANTVTTDGDSSAVSELHRMRQVIGHSYYRRGLELTKENCYDRAIEEWKIARALGYRKADYFLGICYERGCGVEVIMHKALKYYKKSAEDGHAKSMFNYAVLLLMEEYQHPLDISHKYHKLVSYLEKASDLGLTEASVLLGVIYMEFKDNMYAKKAADLFGKAAALKDRSAEYYLGICYERGLGTDINEVQACNYYWRASHGGHCEAQHNLAVFYELGRGGLPRNLDEALRWYTMAADGGDNDSHEEVQRLRKEINDFQGSKSASRMTDDTADVIEACVTNVDPVDSTNTDV